MHNMKYIAILLLILAPLTVSARELRIPRTPRTPRAPFNLPHPRPVPPAPPASPLPPTPPAIFPVEQPEASNGCIECSAPVPIFETIPFSPYQFFVKAGHNVLVMYKFGPYKKYQLLTAINDGSGGQWFRKLIFKPIN